MTAFITSLSVTRDIPTGAGYRQEGKREKGRNGKERKEGSERNRKKGEGWRKGERREPKGHVNTAINKCL